MSGIDQGTQNVIKDGLSLLRGETGFSGELQLVTDFRLGDDQNVHVIKRTLTFRNGTLQNVGGESKSPVVVPATVA